MERTFYGTSTGCDCLGIRWNVEGRNRFNVDTICSYNQTLYGCNQAYPIMPFKMHRFDNRMICGKKGGPAFLNATRPDFDSKLCPNNTLPCSNSTSFENTLCYDKTQPRDSVCPITKFEFYATG